MPLKRLALSNDNEATTERTHQSVTLDAPFPPTANNAGLVEVDDGNYDCVRTRTQERN